MDKLQHRLTEKNTETLTATCLVCGPNTPMYYNASRKHYSCRIRKQEIKRNWAQKNYDSQKNRDVMLKSKYKITQKEYDELLESQGNCCAICKGTEPRGHGAYHIDHDRNCCPRRGSCGKCIRGLLCHSCNTGIGSFKDNIEELEKAILYLKEYNEKTAG